MKEFIEESKGNDEKGYTEFYEYMRGKWDGEVWEKGSLYNIVAWANAASEFYNGEEYKEFYGGVGSNRAMSIIAEREWEMAAQCWHAR